MLFSFDFIYFLPDVGHQYIHVFSAVWLVQQYAGKDTNNFRDFQIFMRKLAAESHRKRLKQRLKRLKRLKRLSVFFQKHTYAERYNS